MNSDQTPDRTQTFWYIAWFRDTTQQPDDQDYETCACILIDAESAELAQSWGDVLSRRFSEDMQTEVFLWSEIEEYRAYKPDSGTPHIAYGDDSSNEYLFG